MKIAVVGCGAVGSYYGARLALAGHQVHFLLRSDFEVVRQQGVCVRSPSGDFQVRPHCACTPEEIGPSDLVLIGLKSTANHQFSRLLPPLVGPATAVLTLQNGLGNEEALARLFPIQQILGGLCFVCLNRLKPGLIHHLDYGLIMVGEFQRPPQPRTHQLAESLRAAGVPCKVSNDLGRAHWEKLIWNIPFNGLGVAGVLGYQALLHPPAPAQKLRPLSATLTTDQLLADAAWVKLLRQLMLEVIAAGRALGHDIPETLADQQLERTRTMGPYKASTLIDFERGLPLELDSLFLEPLRQARQAGVCVPRLQALCQVLTHLDPARPTS